MVGYGTSPASVVMDIDNNNQNQPRSSSKYPPQQQQQYQQQQQQQQQSRSSRTTSTGRDRGMPRDEAIDYNGRSSGGRPSSSSRPSSGGSRSASRYNSATAAPPGAHSTYQPQPPPQQHQPMHYGGGATSSGGRAGGGPTSGPPSSSQAMASQHHFSPPQGHFGHHHSSSRHNTAPATPDHQMQPTFPPPAVTDTSPPGSHEMAQQQQRRPAYLLHRDLVIGKGSYGQVCIASRGEAEGHNATGGTSQGGRSGKRKKFACKCVMLRNDPKYISKLQEEVNVLRELRGHDNVIRLYDVFCVDNELFIITELGRGGDLFHLLTTHPKHGVTEAYAAKTVCEMLSAVAFLHSRSICHRDLKLENWVLESGKDVWSPLKLIDFGLSTHFRNGERLTRVVGSSYYVAPEVLKKSYTEACDLWSLGVIVYMLLSGAPPFYGKNDEAIKASIVQGEYTFPHELFRDVSDEAMAFVSTLLSYNIEYRYTAKQALTHPWLSTNCDPESLHRAKEGAVGRGTGMVDLNRVEPMQL